MKNIGGANNYVVPDVVLLLQNSECYTDIEMCRKRSFILKIKGRSFYFSNRDLYEE